MAPLLRRTPLVVGLLALALELPTGCERGDVRSHAIQISSEAQFIGGPAARAEVGDFLMYNDQIRVAIADTQPSPGFGLYGGALLDVDLVRGPEEYDGAGNDQFGELFPLVNFVAPNPWDGGDDPGSVSIVADGSDGGPAIVRVDGKRDKYLHILKLLPDVLNADEDAFRIRTDYVLNPGVRYLEIVTEVYVPEAVAEANGWPTTTEWHDLADTREPIDPFAQLVNGILPPVLVEATDLEVDPGDPLKVISPSTDFEAAGVAAGHTLKATDADGELARRSVAAVDGDTLTLDEELELADGGAYFRVLGDVGEGGHVFGDFLFPGAKVAFFMPDDANPVRADWNGGLGPGIGFDQYGTTLEVNHSGGSTFTQPLLVDFFAGDGDGVSYAYGVKDGAISIPVMTDSFSAVFTHDSGLQTLLAPGNAVRFTRYLTVGEGDVASAAGVLLEQVREEPVGRIEGHVLDGRRGDGRSGIRVLALRDPDPDAAELPVADQLAGPVTAFETDLARDRVADGSFGGVVPPGDYLLVALGPGHTRSEMARVRVDEGETAAATLVLPETGTLVHDVIDARGEHVPCKLTFYGHDGAGVPDPQFGEGYLPAGMATVEFSADGRGETQLAPGTYDVVISRGPEYTLDRQTVTIVPGTTVELMGHIARVVDTTGWVSGDFHQHMMGSPDSALPWETRVLSNLCEQVEFVATSDHDYNSDLRPVIERMGATEYISSAVGDELTTIEQGHFNGFPLRWDPSLPENGAPEWQLASADHPDYGSLTPEEIFAGLRAAGEYGEDRTVVQANHPRDGILGYFYQYLIDTETGDVPDDFVINYLELGNDVVAPENFDWGFDAIEISNGKRQDLVRTPTHAETAAYLDGTQTMYDHLSRTADEQEALRTGETTLDTLYAGGLDDWFNWLNLGRRYTITGNSDSHTLVSTEGGVVRNYIASPTDLPSAIDEREIAQAVLDHHVLHTWGPFIEFEIEADEGVGGIGDSVVDGDGVVDAWIRVQSPTWFDVDRIEIFQNGVMVCEITGDQTCGEPADNYGLFHPNESVVNFDGTVELDLAEWWYRATPDELMPADIVPLDSWFAVVAMGDSTMEPVASPLDREPLMIADVLASAMGALRFEDMTNPILAGISFNMGADYFKTFDVVPWGITNAIWVDADGDGEWDAPGLPGYLGYYAADEE